MGIKLVIVDDAPFVREAIRNVAEAEHFEILGEASTGTEALDLVSRLNPDIIILDLVLPQMNGIDVAKQLIEKNPAVRILACSTQSQKEMMLKALNAGCKDFLAKPFTGQQLIQKIKSIMKV